MTSCDTCGLPAAHDDVADHGARFPCCGLPECCAPQYRREPLPHERLGACAVAFRDADLALRSARNDRSGPEADRMAVLAVAAHARALDDLLAAARGMP